MKLLVFLGFAFLLQIAHPFPNKNDNNNNIFHWASTGMSFDSPTIFNWSLQQSGQLKLKKPIFKYYPGAESSSVPAFLGGKSLLQQEAEIEVHVYESSSSHREGDLYGGKRYFFAGMLNHPHLLEEEWRQTLVGSLDDEGTIATEVNFKKE